MEPSKQNNPEDILSAWIALEVLTSSEKYEKPDDFVKDNKCAKCLSLDNLPWENGAVHAKRDKRAFYHLVLGALDLKAVEKTVLSEFADKNIERERGEGKAPIAYITLDDRGVPLEADAIAISSCAWGFPKVLAEGLQSLAGWPEVEEQLVEELEKQIYHSDENNKPLPLSHAHIEDIYSWLVERLELRADLIESPSFAMLVYQSIKAEEPPDAPLMNSFFLKDLAQVKKLAGERALNHALRLYLGIESPLRTINILQDNAALEAAVAPCAMPISCWPAKGHHPLVLLQQTAVNLAISGLSGKTGIFAVNGPPGTGKTTLLRDLVAAVVTQRASVMATYEKPEAAFKESEHDIHAGNATLKLYKLDEKLQGFEIVVASMNNKAVENVSKELPGLTAIAEDTDLHYFKSVSDSLMQAESTWGLISAPLGKSSNRKDFKDRIWFHEDFGLLHYLKSAEGLPISKIGEKENERAPHIITREKSPSSTTEALERWNKARAAFLKAQEEAQHALNALETLRQACLALDQIEAEIEKAHGDTATAALARTQAQERHDTAKENCEIQETELTIARKAIKRHLVKRPSIWARMLFLKPARQWKAERLRLYAAEHDADYAFSLQQREIKKAKRSLDKAVKHYAAAHAAETNIQQRKNDALKRIQDGRNTLGANMVDKAFFNQEHERKHMAAPWFDETLHRLRERVFVEAMQLHRAFLDAAARPIRHNIGALMATAMGGGDLGAPEKIELLPDLWSTLFLIVPVISTTFASVERMFRQLSKDALGWLLIDEAGQATPQAAAGAIMRFKRAVVVGDPLQIEPVVTLPSSLTEEICQQLKIDPIKWNAPVASAQTVADRASKYVAEFSVQNGIRKVGVPLLVHRRCQNPMFTIANHVAYDNQMVQAIRPRVSAIRDILGASGWIDIEGTAQEKWCPEEGEEVAAMMRKLAQAGILSPDIFIISPFRVVARKLAEQLKTEPLFHEHKKNRSHWINQNIGTIHTVQGREADSVILVLGAQEADRQGARNWAGQSPNILNVAVTRAQENLYVVGSKKLWSTAGHFKTLAAMLDNKEALIESLAIYSE